MVVYGPVKAALAVDDAAVVAPEVAAPEVVAPEVVAPETFEGTCTMTVPVGPVTGRVMVREVVPSYGSVIVWYGPANLDLGY
jgi:hypothetical protein